MIFPFPSSPHCAPIKMVFDMIPKLGKKFSRRILPDALGIPPENKSACVRRKADCSRREAEKRIAVEIFIS